MSHDFRDRPVGPPNTRRALLTRSIGTKLTEIDYEKCLELAGTRCISEWTREVLLAATTRRSLNELLLAEVLALRSMVINLQMRVAVNGAVTMDEIRSLIDRIDEDKHQRAVNPLTTARRP